MNLLQIRQKFREISGRFDLVNEDGSDNGADFFINEGRKYLDRLNETQKSWGSCFRYVQVNGYSVSIPLCRAIKEVWVGNSEDRWQLEKLTFNEIVTNYMKKIPSQRTSGVPYHYSPIITRYVNDEVQSLSFESYIGWVEIPSGNAYDYNSIVLSVPTDTLLTVEVKGLYYSAELINDTDKNQWTVTSPLLLIMAAMRQIEVINRNTQGVNDWSNAILSESSQLGMDLVEELIAEVSEMEG